MRRRATVLAVTLLAFSATPARASKGVDGVVNLNTAPAEVLALLPGVGPAKAVAVLVYRKRHPFRTVDELVRIKGIGRKMVRRLRPHLAIAGPTTATAAIGKSPGGAAPAPVAPAPPVHATSVPRCAPPRPPARAARATGRERGPRRPFSAPCLGPR